MACCNDKKEEKLEKKEDSCGCGCGCDGVEKEEKTSPKNLMNLEKNQD